MRSGPETHVDVNSVKLPTQRLLEDGHFDGVVTGRLDLRKPTSSEQEKAGNKFMVRGYLASLNRVVPLDDWAPGQVLVIPNATDGVRRSVQRAARKAGIVLQTLTSLEGDALFLNRERTGVNLEPKASPHLYKRPWDALASIPGLAAIRARRESPDGVQRKVKEVMRNRVPTFVFPWGQMQDGDFFIVAMRKGTDKEERSLRTTFHSASCRHDYEIQVVKWSVAVDGEERPGLRVTRIQPHLALLKRRMAAKEGTQVHVSRGRGAKKIVQQQETLHRHIIKAWLEAGYPEQLIKRCIEEAYNDQQARNESQGHTGEATLQAVPGGQGEHASEAPARTRPVDVRPSEAPATPGPVIEAPVRSATPDREGEGNGEPTRPGTEKTGARLPHVESGPELEDDGGEVSLFGSQAPRPAYGRQYSASEPRLVDTSSLSLDQLEGSAYHPDYDRAAVMRERMAQWGIDPEEEQLVKCRGCFDRIPVREAKLVPGTKDEYDCIDCYEE